MKKNKKLLIGLIIAVVVVIGGILIYKGVNNARLDSFYNDLKTLGDKVSYYYDEYGQRHSLDM